jgi:hypothetical protein
MNTMVMDLEGKAPMQQSLTSDQLQTLPELAILVALDAVLQTTIRALLAAHPDLEEDEENPSVPQRMTAATCAADAIIQLSATMLDAIARYQRANHHLLHITSAPPSCINDPF